MTEANTTSTRRSRRSLTKSTFLPTGAKVALVGLLTALATLGFTIWNQTSLYRQVRIRVPLAQSASKLESGVGQSMAGLGGWVMQKDRDARTRSAGVWQQLIAPEYNAISAIAEDVGDREMRQTIEALGAKLREVERLQHVVADLAHTPGNVPASVTYDREVGPSGAFLNLVIRRGLIGVQNSPKATADLNGLDAALTRVDRTLSGLLRDNSPAAQRQLEDEVQRLAELSAMATRSLPPGGIRTKLQLALPEFDTYIRGAQTVAKLRSRPNWNQILHIYKTQLIPVLRDVQALVGTLANTQNNLMISSGLKLARWSPVVVLLALLMGILSGASLYASMRAAYKMREMVNKAKVLGQYVMESRIGGGGMGEVYRARHAMLRRPTAIKLLRASNASSLQAQERFRAEVQLSSQLTHPNTIDIFDYGRTPDGIFYYAMELLDGVDLNTLVEITGSVTPRRTVHILRQVCGSLTEAHGKGLLHRDIKPSNIMLAERGGISDTVKVLDFGLVQRAGDAGSGAIEGTPMFLAPEVITMPDASSPRSDIYALGAVAYRLITGTALWLLKDATEILRAHLNLEVERPSERLGRELPAGLDAIILSCLAKEPHDRPESAAHLASLLDELALPVWTAAEASAWWADYGDALKNAAVAPESVASDVRSGLQINRTGT